jgi:predicted RNase H-like HicB family nuclease
VRQFCLLRENKAKSARYDQKLCKPAVPLNIIMHYTIILDAHEKGGFTARCVEIPGALGHGNTQADAMARIREAIEQVRQAQNEELQKTISAVHSEIIRIEVADSA